MGGKRTRGPQEEVPGRPLAALAQPLSAPPGNSQLNVRYCRERGPYLRITDRGFPGALVT